MKNSKYGMPPPSTRMEFEHNVFLTIEMAHRKIEQNQLDPFFVHKTIPRLRELKYSPNKRLDLNTVDEQLRLESNMLHWSELLPPPDVIMDDDG